MTRQHTGHVQIRGNAKADLRPEDVTVAQTLKQANYATGLIGKWGLWVAEATDMRRRRCSTSSSPATTGPASHAHNFYPTFLVRNEQRPAAQRGP